MQLVSRIISQSRHPHGRLTRIALAVSCIVVVTAGSAVATAGLSPAGAAGSPSIAIAKSANVSNFSAAGTPITYSYQVTNTGNVTLTSVGVTDAMPGLSAVSCPHTTLASAADETCTATYTTTQTDVDAGGITNTGVATGTPPTGPDVTDSDTLTIPSTQNASIGVVTSASISTFSQPGIPVTYFYEVTDTGNVTLSSVDVTDSMAGLSAVNCPDPTLAPAADEICTATYTTTQADVDAGGITTTGVATGTPPNGPDVTASSLLTIPANQNASIEVVKSASVANFAEPGTPITYKYQVTNSGVVTLTSVAVTDAMPGLSAVSCPDRDPGAGRRRDLYRHLHDHPGRCGCRWDHQHRHGHRHTPRRARGDGHVVADHRIDPGAPRSES